MEKRRARLQPIVAGGAEDAPGGLIGSTSAATPPSSSKGRLIAFMMASLLLIIASYALHLNFLHIPFPSHEPVAAPTPTLTSSPTSTTTPTSTTSTTTPAVTTPSTSQAGAASSAASSPAEQKQVASKAEVDPETISTTCGNLSRALLEKHAKNNTVMITFTSHSMFKLYGPTWLSNVRKAGITYWFLVVACQKTSEYVHSMGAHQCFMAEEMEITDMYADYKWGSKTWILHTWQKVLTVRHVAQLGFNVIHSDMDIIWFKDPYSYFMETYTLADYMVSLDPMTTKNPIGDPGPEVGVTAHHYMNTGLYFLRATEGGRALIETWYSIRKEMQEKGYHDQDGLYKHLQRSQERVDLKNRYTNILDGKTKLAQLPANQFQNGYSHYINQLHKRHGLTPYAVHLTWVWGENIGKINRMRAFMYYEDPPAYYQEGKFLSMDLKFIETPAGYNEWRNVLNDTEKMVNHHITSVEAQLAQLYYGWAVAVALNRTFILPKVKCWCIQNWFENPLCRMPGELSTVFPLDCPADYLFHMDKLANLKINGNPIPFREYSFLDNPRTPNEVKDGAVVVTAGDNLSKEARKATLARKQKSGALVPELKQYADAKRIHLTNPTDLFDSFSDPDFNTKFRNLLSELPVTWCCMPDVVLKANKTVQSRHPIKLVP